MALSCASYLWWQPYHFPAESEVIFHQPLHLNLIYHFHIMQKHFETCWSACIYRNVAWHFHVVSTLTEHILTFIIMHIVIGGEYATDRSQYKFLKN